jgi:hypothetical protein
VAYASGDAPRSRRACVRGSPELPQHARRERMILDGHDLALGLALGLARGALLVLLSK